MNLSEIVEAAYSRSSVTRYDPKFLNRMYTCIWMHIAITDDESKVQSLTTRLHSVTESDVAVVDAANRCRPIGLRLACITCRPSYYRIVVQTQAYLSTIA